MKIKALENGTIHSKQSEKMNF